MESFVLIVRGMEKLFSLEEIIRESGIKVWSINQNCFSSAGIFSFPIQ